MTEYIDTSKKAMIAFVAVCAVAAAANLMWRRRATSSDPLPADSKPKEILVVSEQQPE